MKRAWKTFRRILPYVRPYRKLAVLSLILTFLAAGVAVALPWPVAFTFDSVLGNKPLPIILAPFNSLDRFTLLVVLVLSLLGIKAAEGMVDVLNHYATTKLQERVVLDLRSDMFDHAQRLSPAYHDRRLEGGIGLQLSVRSKSAGVILISIPSLLQAIVTLVAMFVITYFIDALLALLALAVVPFIYYSTGYYAKRIEPRLMKVRNMEGKSVSIAHEAMAMLRVVVPFGREEYHYRRFRDQGETAVDARVDLTVRQTLFSMAVNVITGVGIALVLGVGAYRILTGQMSGGYLLVVFTYVGAAYAPLQQIAATFSMLQEEFVYLRGALGVLNAKPEVEDAPDAYKLDRAQGSVSFEGVYFRYEKKGADTLKAVSFEAQAGQRVAIVGPTGAGKTTLVNLIMRFFDPQQGRIRLDGIDIRKLTLKSLRAQISTVMQEPLLFSDTIADNIRYGRLDASMEEVKAAARAANAHEFIMRLPRKYNTKLGERGATLSGGERQRITIARAFLKDAPILILDEPTSSIDSRTEAAILDSLERLMAGRTTFIITHRLSAIRNADFIIVLEQGRLAEQGTHDELLRREGLYKRLHEAQTRQAQHKGRTRHPQKPHRLKQDASAGAFVTADPNPVLAGAGPGKTTISWSTGDGSWGRVYHSKDGGPEKLLDGGAKGSKEFPWIQPNATYEFRLYVGKNRSAHLAAVTVARSDKVPQEPDDVKRNGGRKVEDNKRVAKAPGSLGSDGPPKEQTQRRA